MTLAIKINIKIMALSIKIVPKVMAVTIILYFSKEFTT